jgi:hypothetical protein
MRGPLYLLVDIVGQSRGSDAFEMIGGPASRDGDRGGEPYPF